MRKTTRLGLLIGLLFSSSLSFAGGYVRFAGLYLSDSSGQGTLTSTTRTLMEAGGGWVSSGGWTVGGLYALEKIKNNNTSTDRTSMGPTVGWMGNKGEGFYALATYHYSSELSPNYKGSGYQVDGGYKFKVRNLGLALQMSYKHFEYNKAGSATLTPSLVTNKIDPYVGLFFEF